jgi:hypothetical protein
MDAVHERTMTALAAQGFAGLDCYSRALESASREVRPLFGRSFYGDIYREAALNPQWLAISLIANAEREGDGATRLWSLAACTPAEDVAAEVRRHGIDESMHSLAYLRILDVVFPGSVEEGFRRQLEGLSPKYGSDQVPVAVAGSAYAHAVTVDDLIQMNIAEIRTRIHHLLQRPMVLGHCPEDRRPLLRMILDRLLADETRHIGYTARLIEAHARQAPDEVEELLLERMRDFNAVTDDELGHRVFD